MNNQVGWGLPVNVWGSAPAGSLLCDIHSSAGFISCSFRGPQSQLWHIADLHQGRISLGNTGLLQ